MQKQYFSVGIYDKKDYDRGNVKNLLKKRLIRQWFNRVGSGGVC